jgi:hypothetical protein
MHLRVDEIFHKFGEFSLLREFSRKVPGLFRGGDLSSEQQPEHTLRNDFLPSRGRGEDFLTVRNRKTVEPDALLRGIGQLA